MPGQRPNEVLPILVDHRRTTARTLAGRKPRPSPLTRNGSAGRITPAVCYTYAGRADGTRGLTPNTARAGLRTFAPLLVVYLPQGRGSRRERPSVHSAVRRIWHGSGTTEWVVRCRTRCHVRCRSGPHRGTDLGYGASVPSGDTPSTNQ